MKRKQILKRIAQEARARGVNWSVLREGANHTVFMLGGTRIPMPRHSEIDDHMARIIFRECEAELGKNWWRDGEVRGNRGAR